MGLTLTPQTKDYGDAIGAPNIEVKVEESDNLEVRGTARIIDGENNTVKTETFTAKGKHNYIPDIPSVWSDMAEGSGSVQLTVTSYEEIKEQAINGSTTSLYMPNQSIVYNGGLQRAPLVGYDSTKMDVDGDFNATNAGTYTFRVKPKDGYKWSTPQQNAGDKGWISFTWTIQKAPGYMYIGGTRIQHGGTYNIIFSYVGERKEWSVSGPSSNFTYDRRGYSSIADLSVYGKVMYSTCNSSGSTEYTIWSLGNDNYNNALIKFTLSCTVKKTISSLPEQSNTLYADGSRYQSPTWSNYNTNELYISGGTTSEIGPGYFYTTFKPMSGYQWWDGTTSEKYVSWTINESYSPPTPTYSNPCTISPSSVTVSYSPLTYGYVTITNTTYETIGVEVRCANGYGGPYPSFNLNAESVRPYEFYTSDSERIGPYSSKTLKIYSGPPSVVGYQNEMKVTYTDSSNNVIGSDYITVYTTS